MSTLTNSQLLRHKIALVFGKMAAAGGAIYNHPESNTVYPEYLFAIHCMIRSSVQLMEAAVQQSRAMADRDPVATGVADYLAQHIREERNHDEWLLDDLAVLGWKREDVLKRQPYPVVAALVGAQYYWVFHYHPVALLGYIAVLEGYPPTVEQLEEQIARTGLPREAFRTLIKHAHLDPHHRDDLNVTLDRLPLTREHTGIIGVSAMQTVQLASEALREAVERSASAAPV